ncbi:MAG TPA: hypothetical protein VGQ00_02580 [Candidatus Norongarragalinales archaeon]|jgi:hypothetical protein|nr:hypothetical protein [Candidatus Norongarragalinales archaeon]
MAKHKAHKKAKGPLNDLTSALVLKNIENGVSTPGDSMVRSYVDKGVISKQQVAQAQNVFVTNHKRGLIRIHSVSHGHR